MNCPNCGEILRQEWDNVGFTPPEGPDKWEVIDEVCDYCGYSDYYNGQLDNYDEE